MKVLMILNDPPYGTERNYNALRLAKSLMKQEGVHITLFLMADAVTCARAAQKTPSGYYNIELMLKAVLRGPDNHALLCGTCMDARGLTDDDVIEGAQRSDMETLSNIIVEADKVLVY